MGFTYSMLSLAVTLCTSIISTFLYRAIFRPYGWTRKENDGVAVRFKVFLPLYLKNPEKWVLMSDAARYEKMMVYFSTGIEWRKYNRWRKLVRKQRQRAEQEERQRKFMEAIFEDYQPEPNPEFTPPPTVKPKTNKDKPTNAEFDKIWDDLKLTENIYPPTDPEKLKAEIKRWADSKDWGINPLELAVKATIEQYRAKKPSPRCKDCKHFMLFSDGNKVRELCGKHREGNGFVGVWSTMVACGLFEPKAEYKNPLETVQTHPLRTTEHYE